MATWFWEGDVQIGPSGQLFTTGTGSPEGATIAPIGSMYLRVDGGPNQAIYIKESGSGNTGWTAVGGAGTSVSLRHNGVDNSVQNVQDLTNGNGISVVDLGAGIIQINGVSLLVNGVASSSQTILDVRNGTGIVVTDIGSGRVQISTSSAPASFRINGSPISGTNPINFQDGSGISISDLGGGVVAIASTPVAPSAVDTPVTTALLNPLGISAYSSSNTESSFVNLDKAGTLLKVVVNRPARVRLYMTTATRDADLTRSNATPPAIGTQHGVLVDLFLDGIVAPLTWLMLPAAVYFNGDFPTQTRKIYYNITNLDTGSATVVTTLTTVQEES